MAAGWLCPVPVSAVLRGFVPMVALEHISPLQVVGQRFHTESGENMNDTRKKEMKDALVNAINDLISAKIQRADDNAHVRYENDVTEAFDALDNAVDDILNTLQYTEQMALYPNGNPDN